MDEIATIVRLNSDAQAVVAVHHNLRSDYQSIPRDERAPFVPVRDEFVVALGDFEFVINEGQLRVLRDRIRHALADQETAIELREAWR